MAIRINDDLRSFVSLGTQRATSVSEKLAEGKRITSAADDPSGVQIAKKLEILEDAARQGAVNLNDGISAVQIADQALSESSNNITRLRDIALQAQSGSVGPEEQAVLQEEYDAITTELSRTANNANFNEQALLSDDNAEIVVSDGGSGSGGQIEVPVSDQSAEALDLAGRDVSDAGTLAAIDRASEQVSQARSELGSATQSIESRIRSLKGSEENYAAGRSRIEDADIAELSAKRLKNQILQESGIATQAQAERLHAGAVLRLLEG